MPHLTKSDFIQYLNCPKSCWLKKYRPDVYPDKAITAFQKKLIRDGYAVETEVRYLIAARDDADRYAFQRVFETDDGLFARADLVRTNEDGTLDLFEIKSSTKVKAKAPDYQLKDAAFQAITVQRCGFTVRNIFIIHLYGDYYRNGELNCEALFDFEDVTDAVATEIPETEMQIEAALDLLRQVSIDETSCSCLSLGRGRHCDTFDYFNADIPDPSIYDLPRISQSKNFSTFVSESRFALDDIRHDELSGAQQLVLNSHQIGGPVVDEDAIQEFLNALVYPLYFLDYEAFASAIPPIDGAWPHAQIPFQYSLHILDEDGELTHHEYLAERIEMPGGFLEALVQAVGTTGSVVSWHKSYEITRNREMAERFQKHAGTLEDITARTIDLEEIFKTGYVDIAFRGSTSIKKVLPALVPDMTYEDMVISDGTAAMEGWLEMVDMPAGDTRETRRRALLEYCEQDTLAMVRILEFLKALD